jgi:hypothetical protein
MELESNKIYRNTLVSDYRRVPPPKLAKPFGLNQWQIKLCAPNRGDDRMEKVAFTLHRCTLSAKACPRVSILVVQSWETLVGDASARKNKSPIKVCSNGHQRYYLIEPKVNHFGSSANTSRTQQINVRLNLVTSSHAY